MSKTFQDLLLHPEPSGTQRQDDPGRFQPDSAVEPPLGADTASRNALVEGCTLESDLAALYQAQDRRAQNLQHGQADAHLNRIRVEQLVLRALHSPLGLRGAALPDDHPEVESAINFIHQARKEAQND